MILQMVEAKKARKIRQPLCNGLSVATLPRGARNRNTRGRQVLREVRLDNLITDLGTRDNDDAKDFGRILTTPPHYAYVKIAEGCNRFCSYCAIPLITGRFVSYPMEELLDEVRSLVARGVKEFQIIAQDLSSYGLDLYGELKLPELIDRMAQIPGVK